MKRPDSGLLLRAVGLTATLLAGVAGAQEQSSVHFTLPEPHSLSNHYESGVTIAFDREIDQATVTRETFWAFGESSGVAEGTIAFGIHGGSIFFEPDRPFAAGEMVTVFLSEEAASPDGTPLAPGGHSFQFWMESRGAGFDFTETARFSTRTTPAESSRAYGGFSSDLNGDGFLDLTIVNEDTDDLRTFLNRADRSGRFEAFLQPTAGTGATPSPSKPSDFDRDGNVDVVVANTRADTVSVLLGNGDGTFGAARDYVVGGQPRGVATLDADGDGDVDVAATSFIDGTITVLFNDGQGGFGNPSTFGSGGGEWALAAGDMNNDGWLDLVAGAQTTGRIHVYLANGDGTFTEAGSRSAGGAVWMLTLGDLDGDGDEDVATANGPSNNATILMGDGTGRLTSGQVQPIDPFGLSTDLADLDGDGDLDWVTSSFDGDWLLFENDGAGAFTPAGSFPATQTASCSIPMDVDNDRVVDLVLVDEIEDEVIVMRSRAVVFASGFEVGDTSDWSRTRGRVAVISPGLRRTGHALEVALGGTRARSFVESRHPEFETSFVVGFDLAVQRADLGGRSLEILQLRGRNRKLVLTLSEAGGIYRVTLSARHGGRLREIGSTKVPAARRVRLEVGYSTATGLSSADGTAVLRKKGRIRAQARDLDNFHQFVRKVRIGLPRGSAGSGEGALLIDEYVSTR